MKNFRNMTTEEFIKVVENSEMWDDFEPEPEL